MKREETDFDARLAGTLTSPFQGGWKDSWSQGWVQSRASGKAGKVNKIPVAEVPSSWMLAHSENGEHLATFENHRGPCIHKLSRVPESRTVPHYFSR